MKKEFIINCRNTIIDNGVELWTAGKNYSFYPKHWLLACNNNYQYNPMLVFIDEPAWSGFLMNNFAFPQELMNYINKRMA